MKLTAGFVVNGRLLSTAGTGDAQKAQRHFKLAARQDVVQASRRTAADERVSLHGGCKPPLRKSSIGYVRALSLWVRPTAEPANKI